MRKSFILLTICALAGLWSCQSRIEDETPITYASDESEVEITVAADRTPRNVPSATPDENIIDNLDILLFDSNGKFICWRATFKINGKLRTTLPVGKDYDAYFLANCRSFIGEMLPDKATEEQYRQQADWEVFRKTLVDANPQRLLQENTAFTSLPMWGMLKKQDVNDRVINYWPLLSLTRSVASVDVYVANGIDYFILKDITLFHVPDKGLLGNVPANVTDGQALEASSPADMQTGLTLESDSYNILNEYVAENKVMPASVDSATGQRDNIVVTILEDGAACLSVDTETQAQRGAQINVVIRPTKMEAIITVGSWQIRKAVTVL